MSKRNAVIRINQIDRGTIGAEKTSPFTITLHSPNDHTDLGAIPGLAAADAGGGWSRLGQDAAQGLAESIGATLRASGVPFRVEWV